MTTAGIDAGLAGNVGRGLAAQVAEVHIRKPLSFQLDGMFDFLADIAVLTNITPDRFDRAGPIKFENYIDSKFRILNNMRPSGFVYLRFDSEAVGL